MQKLFFTPAVLGTVLGLALIGYSVFAAFQPPTAAPPGDNVAPPLNTSNTEQTKGGGLIVNSNNFNITGLKVEGYLQVDTGTPSGDCTSGTHAGRMIYDPGTNTLYICDGTTWQAH